MIGNLIKYHHPTHIVACCDPKNCNSLRKSLYPDYKANRTCTTGIDPQEIIIRDLLNEIGIPTVEVDRYEADDLLGTLSRRFSDQIKTVVVTGDKDLMVLVDEKVTMLDTMKKKEYQIDDVVEKYGIAPHKVSDYLALVGDKADNIPGAKGIGPVAAKNLLNQFESVGDIYKNINDVADSKVKAKLVASKSDALISAQLAYLQYDVDIDLSLDQIKYEPQITPRFVSICSKLSFRESTIQDLQERLVP
jgi:DNA polymerase-1